MAFLYAVLPTGRTVQRKQSENCPQNVHTQPEVLTPHAGRMSFAGRFERKPKTAVLSDTEPVQTKWDGGRLLLGAATRKAAETDPLAATVQSHRRKKTDFSETTCLAATRCQQYADVDC